MYFGLVVGNTMNNVLCTGSTGKATRGSGSHVRDSLWETVTLLREGINVFTPYG